MQRKSWSRRTMSTTALIGACLAGSGLQAADLTVTSYGGIFEQTVRQCFVAPFEKQTGKSVGVVLGDPAQWINQVLASPAKPPLDVIMMNATFTYQARDKGALEAFTPDRVPALVDVPKPMIDMFNGYAAVMDFGIMGIAYDKRQIKNPPQTFQEFVDRTIKGEWRASLPGIAYSGTPYYLIWGLADIYGGSLTNVDPAFDAIRRMKASGNVVFWNGSSDFINLMQGGEFEIGMFFDGRAFAYMDQGVDWLGFVNPKPGAVMGPTTIAKVANTTPLGWDFINIVLSPEPQACFAEKMQYGIVNTKARLSPKTEQRVIKWNDTRLPPYEHLGKEIPRWIERWNKEIGG